MFEQLVNDAAAHFNVPAAGTESLLRGLLALITSARTGGAEGFVERFRRAGLEDVVTSWFGGREGRSITPAQLESAIGSVTLDRLAGSSGLTRGLAASALTYLLPKVIGRLTPGGTLPSMNTIVAHVGGWLDRPPDVDRGITAGRPMARIERVEEPRGWPVWLPWAAIAALAFAGILWLRTPGGTIDPQLTLANRDGTITYAGVVRDEESRMAIQDALRSTFGRGRLDGELRVDSRVKRADWLPRVGHLLPALRTPGVELSISGDRVDVRGWLSDAERQALGDRVRGIMGPSASIGTLGDPESEAVRAANDQAIAALRAVGTSGGSADALVQALNMTVIMFPVGSAQLPADGLEVIDICAQALKRAPPGSIVEVQGHTDDTGDPDRNLALSQARAEAVREALIRAGVPAALLAARGYGATHPRASNETEYGRFQNRRIEYALIPAATARQSR